MLDDLERGWLGLTLRSRFVFIAEDVMGRQREARLSRSKAGECMVMGVYRIVW